VHRQLGLAEHVVAAFDETSANKYTDEVKITPGAKKHCFSH
jgi:hypothetical protein